MAITYGGYNGSNGTNSIAFGTAATTSLNDLIVVIVNMNPSTQQFPTVSDSLNGTYNAPTSLNFFSSQNTGGTNGQNSANVLENWTMT